MINVHPPPPSPHIHNIQSTIIGIVIRSGSRSASISKNKIEAILKKTIVIGRLEGDLPLFVSYSYDHCLRVGNFGRQNAGADTLIGLCE